MGSAEKNPRIFLIGDHSSNTGPARVTRAYAERLPKGSFCLEDRGAAWRAFNIAWGMRNCDVAVFSGYSRQNLLGMRAARFFGKKSIYLMHGCVEYENRINREEDPEMADNEREMLSLTDLIAAVSPVFEKWLKDNYPEHREKITCLPNAVDWEELPRPADIPRGRHALMSVGGGMPRKRIADICRAAELLRSRKFPDLKLAVAGERMADSEEIDGYSFVKDFGKVRWEKMRLLYSASSVFIQNSSFETFALAPLEALSCGASLLLSRHCGVLDFLPSAGEADIIENVEDEEEIAFKISGLIEGGGNNERLLKGVDRESNTWEKRMEQLRQMAGQLA